MVFLFLFDFLFSRSNLCYLSLCFDPRLQSTVKYLPLVQYSTPPVFHPLPSGGLPHPAGTGLRLEEEDGERGDMAFLKDLLSPGPGASDEFSREWQDAFGLFDPPSAPPPSTGAASSGPAARPPSNPPSPTGFLPSQLLDHSLSSTGQPHRTLLEG